MPEITKEILFEVKYHPDAEYTGLYNDIGPSVIVNAARLDLGTDSIYTAAHELSHAQRDALSELNTSDTNVEFPPDGGPVWLEEGNAVFLACHAISESGLWSYENVRNYYLNRIKTSPSASGSLEEIEAFSDFHSNGLSSYSYSMLAVELLASFTGQSSLMDYYESLKAGTTWQDVFQSTFGMSVNEFYERFEEHEARGFPSLETPKFVD